MEEVCSKAISTLNRPFLFLTLVSLWDQSFDTANFALIKYIDPVTRRHEQLRLFEDLTPHWEDVALYIGLPPAVISAIASPGLGKTQSTCLREVLGKWEDGSTRYPATWKGVCDLLKDSRRVALAEKLQAAIDTETSTLRDNYSPGAIVDRAASTIDADRDVAMAERGQADLVFTEEHESTLTDILANSSGKWREIRMSLNLPKSVESNIEARLHMYDNIVCLGKVLHEWIVGGHKHAKAPTLANLKKALASRTVGLGKEASLLEERLKECGGNQTPTVDPNLVIPHVEFEAPAVSHQMRFPPAGPTSAPIIPHQNWAPSTGPTSAPVVPHQNWAPPTGPTSAPVVPHQIWAPSTGPTSAPVVPHRNWATPTGPTSARVVADDGADTISASYPPPQSHNQPHQVQRSPSICKY